MENKKRIIIIGGVVMIIILIVVSVGVIRNKKNSQTPKETEMAKDISQKEEIVKNKIQNIKGKVSSIDIGTAEIVGSDGEKLSLKISQKGVSLLKQIQQGEGNGLLKEISIAEVPLNQEVDIQYNSQDNELMLIIVK
ncbi:MAG: hypothetical protein WA055_00455 [Candidatus Moraniibacteriota bacterium]